MHQLNRVQSAKKKKVEPNQRERVTVVNFETLDNIVFASCNVRIKIISWTYIILN